MLRDYIDRTEIINKICSLIDTLPQDENICLSIHGVWGSGKSFVLNLLNEKLSAKKEYFIVKYDAWKNNFYSDPLIAILFCILDTLKLEIDNLGKKNLMKKINKAIKSKIWRNGINKLQSLNRWYGLVAKAIVSICNIIQQAKSSILDNEPFEDFKSYQQVLNESIDILNGLTVDNYNGRQRRVVILVDEVDRCLPNEQLLVLERIHHLFQVKNCAVIVALNKDFIKNTFTGLYKEDGNLYLKKFFNYNFIIQVNYSIFLRNKLNDTLDELNKRQTVNNLLIKEDTDYISSYLSKACSQYSASKNELMSFSNRDAERLISCACNIYNQINEFEINFCYLWFIFIMTFEKLFGQNFQRYKSGTYADQTDFFEIDYMMPLQEINKLEYDCHYAVMGYAIYNDTKVNQLKYMINQFASRNSDSPLRSALKNFESKIGISKAWEIDKLEKIIYIIDNYS